MRLPFFYGLDHRHRDVRHHGDRRQRPHVVFAVLSTIVDEFGWERGVTAGAFSFGFLVSGAVSPLIGRMMDRFGPRAVMELGVALMAGGLLLAPLTTRPWHLYLTIGVMVGSGSVCLGYSGQSLFLPNGSIAGAAWRWPCIRRRWYRLHHPAAMAQHMIEQTGWRTACTAIGIVVLVVLAPINLLLRKRPEDIGLRPDGDAAPSRPRSRYLISSITIGPASTGPWAAQFARHGLVARARLFLRLYIWYAVQVHRPNTFWTSALVRASRSGLWARSACSVFPPDRARTPLRSAGARMDLDRELHGFLSSALRH